MELVGTLFTGQALFWFVPLFEKNVAIFSNFEVFLGAFSEAFGEYDKIHSATTKIRSLRQGTQSTSNYASEFWQLACDINRDEPNLISQFYSGRVERPNPKLLSRGEERNPLKYIISVFQ